MSDSLNMEYQRCSNCVMDTSDGKISFDDRGVCARCNEYEQRILKGIMAKDMRENLKGYLMRLNIPDLIRNLIVY